MSFPTTIVIADAKPSIVIQALEGISLDAQGLLRVESQPSVLSVNYLAVNGKDGEDGETPDFGDPGTVADLIAALSGEITSSQLHSDLLRSIEKIDVGPTSLEAQASLLAYADEMLNVAIAEDSARIDANESAVTALDGRLDTFGVDLATLDGLATANSAAIDSIETRVVAAEADIYTQAQTIQGISSRLDITEDNLTAQAAIVNQNTTAITDIDGDITSVAETLSTITAGVGGMDAAIQIKNQVVAGTTTPLFAQHTVKIDVNGKISGFGLTSTDDASVFEILADRFAVTNGLNSGIIPFIVDGANVYIQNGFIQNAAIDTARIADASITTAKIQDAQITNALIADATIDAAKIKDATITTAKIADATITTAKIQNAAIDNAKIGNYIASVNFNGDVNNPWGVPGTAGWIASKNGGVIVTNALKARGEINVGAFTGGYAWPASGSGVHLSQYGILCGNANSGGKYFQIYTPQDGSPASINTNIPAYIADSQITNVKIANGAITNAKIGDAAVTTLKIGGNAVTLPVGASAYAAAYGNDITLLSVAFTAVGQPVLLNACCVVRPISGTAGTYRLLLYVDSTPVFDTGICSAIVAAANGSVVTNLSHVVSVSAAYHTFSLVGYSDPDLGGDCNFLARTLVATELRR